MLIVETGSFIGGIINSYIASQTELTVMSIHPETPDELLSSLSQYQPQIVLMDTTNEGAFLKTLTCHMTDPLSPKVVVINVAENDVMVYESHFVKLVEATDFFSIL